MRNQGAQTSECVGEGESRVNETMPRGETGDTICKHETETHRHVAGARENYVTRRRHAGNGGGSGLWGGNNMRVWVWGGCVITSGLAWHGSMAAWLDRSIADAPSLPMRRVRCLPNHGRPFSGTSRRTAASSAGVVGRHREWALLDQGWGMGGTCRVKERERKRFTDRSAEAEETTTAAGLWALDWAFGVGGGERGGCGVGRGRAAKKKGGLAMAEW